MHDEFGGFLRQQTAFGLPISTLTYLALLLRGGVAQILAGVSLAMETPDGNISDLGLCSEYTAAN